MLVFPTWKLENIILHILKIFKTAQDTFKATLSNMSGCVLSLLRHSHTKNVNFHKMLKIPYVEDVEHQPELENHHEKNVDPEIRIDILGIS